MKKSLILLSSTSQLPFLKPLVQSGSLLSIVGGVELCGIVKGAFSQNENVGFGINYRDCFETVWVRTKPNLKEIEFLAGLSFERVKFIPDGAGDLMFYDRVFRVLHLKLMAGLLFNSFRSYVRSVIWIIFKSKSKYKLNFLRVYSHSFFIFLLGRSVVETEKYISLYESARRANRYTNHHAEVTGGILLVDSWIGKDVAAHKEKIKILTRKVRLKWPGLDIYFKPYPRLEYSSVELEELGVSRTSDLYRNYDVVITIPSSVILESDIFLSRTIYCPIAIQDSAYCKALLRWLSYRLEEFRYEWL